MPFVGFRRKIKQSPPKAMPGYHILMSYGATDTISGFLSPTEVLFLQALNRWMYEKGVSRVQQKWGGACKVDFAILTNPRTSSKVTCYDGLSATACAVMKLQDEDFKGHKVVQVMEDIYTISEQNLSVTRYSDLQDDGSMNFTRTDLAALYVSRT